MWLSAVVVVVVGIEAAVLARVDSVLALGYL
jgi:hypothetical protein